MNLSEAKRHAEHLCDVWPTDEHHEHIGVIEKIRKRAGEPHALVSGHPQYGAEWIPVSALGTCCKVRD